MAGYVPDGVGANLIVTLGGGTREEVGAASTGSTPC